MPYNKCTKANKKIYEKITPVGRYHVHKVWIPTGVIDLNAERAICVHEEEAKRIPNVRFTDGVVNNRHPYFVLKSFSFPFASC